MRACEPQVVHLCTSVELQQVCELNGGQYISACIVRVFGVVRSTLRQFRCKYIAGITYYGMHTYAGCRMLFYAAQKYMSEVLRRFFLKCKRLKYS